MIFLSHSHLDKRLVEPIANRLEKTFGKKNIFYDSWSIQPGEQIIGKMNEGLKNFKFFFFFISKQSIQSKIVALEWQNALYRALKENISFIPVRLEECMIPLVLLQNKYIDFFGQGFEVGIRQMIDVIRNENIYQPSIPNYENVRAYIQYSASKALINVEFKAETYMEPQSRYAIFLLNKKCDLGYTAEGAITFCGIEECVYDGQNCTAIWVTRESPTSPGFPFRVTVTTNNNTQILLKNTGHCTSVNASGNQMFKMIPTIILPTTFEK